MAVSAQSDLSYEEFYRAHADRFSAFLGRTLGRQREGADGRIGVADTLQEAMLQIHRQWPELQRVGDEERDRRLYRCLRDAAGEALRREHGRVDARRERPRIVAYDFGLLHELPDDDVAVRDRELTTAVLGSMAADLAAAAQDVERRAVLDRAVLLAGLRALSEREAVVLIAVDHLGWEQDELAEHLGMGFGALRTVLFEARRVFYGVARHAAGVELDEQERAQLHAYRAGELAGRERRVARRHVQHCESCRALLRELGRFGDRAHRVLAPLPFVLGASALGRPASSKLAAVGAGGAGKGLLAQAGAAKALGVTVGVLGVGVGTSAWLAERQEPPGADAPVAAAGVLSLPTRLGVLPAHRAHTTRPAARRSVATTHRHRGQTPHATSQTQSSALAPPAGAAATQPAAGLGAAPPATGNTVSTAGGGAASPAGASNPAGSSNTGGSGGGEFFGQ